MNIRPVDAQCYESGRLQAVRNHLAVEAILQIRVNGVAYTSTVRTPGDDAVLARGLLYCEGVLPDPGAAWSATEILDPESGLPGVLDIAVSPESLAKPIDDRRSLSATASCGLCGLRDAEDLKLYGGPLVVSAQDVLSLEGIPAMFRQMESAQPVFQATGGCHAAAAFTLDGAMLALHEDIGRHNAVDKVIGGLIQSQQLGAARCLVVSGRLSYELIFKAFHARIPFLLSVSAPSSMAVEMGDRFGLTVIGFCRGERATVYAHAERCQVSVAK